MPKLYLQLWFDFSALVRRGSERLMFFDHGFRCVLRALSLILAAVVVLTSKKQPTLATRTSDDKVATKI